MLIHAVTFNNVDEWMYPHCKVLPATCSFKINAREEAVEGLIV
jgi:hypothetical protein